MRRKVAFVSLVILTICLVIALFLLVDGQNQRVLPTWIKAIDDDSSDSDWILIEINQGGLWEIGDTRAVLEEQIRRSLHLSIDGVELRPRQFLLNSSFLLPVYVYDDEGNEIGTYAQESSIWFFPPNKIGKYVAKVEITKTSGVTVSYSWEFDVTEAELKTPTPTLSGS